MKQITIIVTFNLEICSQFLMIKMASTTYVDFSMHHKADSTSLLSSKIWCRVSMGIKQIKHLNHILFCLNLLQMYDKCEQK